MKTNTRKVAIFIYTFILSIATIFLFTLSIHPENLATSSDTDRKITIENHLPSGTKYKKIEYGQSFSVYDLFSVASDERLNMTIHVSAYDTTKLGTTDIYVSFEKDNSTSKGLIRLTVIDTQKPTITLQDSLLNQNDPFDPAANVTAEDNVDQDLTSKIVVNGTVDTSLPGEYRLDYQVEDSSGNITNANRLVTVLETIVADVNPQPSSTETGKDVFANNTTTINTTKQEPPLVVNEPVSIPEPAVEAIPTNSLIISGTNVPYQNGGQGAGQSIIDSDMSGTVSTWGGAPIQSGSDGMNTHFIGHNPGIFSILFSVGIGSPIVVTDSTGQTTTYIVNNIIHVDDSGIELSTQINYWDLIVGTGDGERITLQTCISDTENLIVLASK